MQLISPGFAPFRVNNHTASWAEAVTKTFTYLAETHQIHAEYYMRISIFSRPFPTWIETKRIAQAVLHFWSPFEAVAQVKDWTPGTRQHMDIASRQAIEKLEAIQYLQGNPLRTILARLPLLDDWCHIVQRNDSPRIHFSMTPVPGSIAHLLGWIRLVVFFAQASMTCNNLAQLRAFPRDRAGLVAFITAFT